MCRRRSRAACSPAENARVYENLRKEAQSFFAAESDFLSELEDEALSDFCDAFSRARFRVP